MYVVTETAGSSPGRSDEHGESTTVRDTYAARETELVSYLVVQVPYSFQTHRRHLTHHFSSCICFVQYCLLVYLFVPRGSRGVINVPMTCDKT